MRVQTIAAARDIDSPADEISLYENGFTRPAQRAPE
jgi:hypothetical protein